MREGSKRVMKCAASMQMIGGMALHFSKIAEMGTGEARRSRPLPVYLNALTGRACMSSRTTTWPSAMRSGWARCTTLDLTVGINLPRCRVTREKQAAYPADITYGTNNEYSATTCATTWCATGGRPRAAPAIIRRRVDSILIDEARTPLIISGRGGSHPLYVPQQDGPPPDRQARRIPAPTGVTKPGDFDGRRESHQIA